MFDPCSGRGPLWNPGAWCTRVLFAWRRGSGVNAAGHNPVAIRNSPPPIISTASPTGISVHTLYYRTFYYGFWKKIIALPKRGALCGGQLETGLGCEAAIIAWFGAGLQVHTVRW